MVSKKITALTGSGQTQPETSQKDIYPEIIPLDMGAIAGQTGDGYRCSKSA